MVVPAGPFQSPAVREAQRMGLEALAIDRSPRAIALSVANFSKVIDPLDVDRATKTARDYGVSGVIAAAHDPSVVPAALIAERLGLSGLPVEVARTCCNKRLSRARLRELLPEYCPGYCVLTSAGDLSQAPERLGLPMVLKPSDSHGSRGVIIVDEEARFEEGYHYALECSREGMVLAEELLRGRELSVESVTCDGETEVVAIGDTIVSSAPFCVITAHTMPSTLAPEGLGAVQTMVKRVIETFGIEQGPTHVELYLTDDGPKLLEVSARLSGGCIASHLVPLSTGVNLIRAAIRIALGERPEIDPPRQRGGAAIRFLTSFARDSDFDPGLDGVRDMPGIVEVASMLDPGDSATPPSTRPGRIGYVIADGSDAQEAAQNAERAIDAIRNSPCPDLLRHEPGVDYA